MKVDARHIRSALTEAVAGSSRGQSTAERLCSACVELLSVDGAALSLVLTRETAGTLGASDQASRVVDTLQFDLGVGPCWDAVTMMRPVLVADLTDDRQQRWPAFASGALDFGVQAVFALPVSVATRHVAALDLFRHRPGPLDKDVLVGGLLAAELATLPLLDLMGQVEQQMEGDPWFELGTLDRIEVYQATGMVMGQLDVDIDEALVRLRAHAFAEGLSVTEVAWAILERRLRLDSDGASS